MHQMDPEREPTITDDDSLYPYVNNDIEDGLFEDIVDSYYLDSQIKDDFLCNHNCYSQHRDPTTDNYSNTCTHDYHHITQSIQDLSDSTQQNTLHSIEENASLFADNTATHCDFNIKILTLKMQMILTRITCQNNPASTHIENTHTETLLANQTYNIMTLTIKTLSHLQTNIQHCYNKNYNTHIGIYTTR